MSSGSVVPCFHSNTNICGRLHNQVVIGLHT